MSDKKCACCGHSAAAPTCPRCGEASWLACSSPAPEPEQNEPEADEPAAPNAPPAGRRGRRRH